MSNRAPIRIVREAGKQKVEPTVGGVGSTFLRLLEIHGGTWIAWSGSKSTPAEVRLPPDDPRFTIRFAPLSERDISYYYYGVCNRGLWPLMHLMTQNCHFDALGWNYYLRVNRVFAEQAVNVLADNDVVWVQDFHLAGVPKLLRERRVRNPIGLFWHVPFPPEQLYRIFPWREELLAGMLGCDLIGFHTRSYADHFLNCCDRILHLPVDRVESTVLNQGRVVKVGAFPLGIPADYFAGLAQSPRVRERALRIRRGLRSPIVILGVDRLDYTKGILERLAGYERFLEHNPEYRRQVTFVQIAVPSRTRVSDYMKLKRDLDEQVGHALGRFSSEGWVPIRYLYTQFGAEELVAYYQAADIALLTPLRDGMNLVAKEYVASRSGDDGVLVLSEFCGAAEELSDALLVNPYDVGQIAEQLRRAVTMGKEEKAVRMSRLRVKVKQNDLERWSGSFLAALAAAHRSDEQSVSLPAPN